MAMEGFSGVLRRLEVDGKISLIPKCKKGHISHLIFADDLMIFVKAVSDSVIASLGALDGFASYSGLHLNRAKSSIILEGLTHSNRMQLLELTGSLKDGKPDSYPMRGGCSLYPLFFKAAISIGQASSAPDLALLLREKFTISPGKLSANQNMKEGLGLKRIKEMNVAGIMKQFWWIASHKNSFWVNWIYTRYLKNDSIWTVRPSSNSSWVWRKIIKYRDIIEPHVHHLIGDGRLTNLWLDNWHPSGILLKRFGDRIQYDVESPRLAKVVDILREGEWHPSPPTSMELMETWGALPDIHKLPYADRDMVVWKDTLQDPFPPNQVGILCGIMPLRLSG
ncbi:uncharacterized protein LOC122094777 [Macadamia integrifolia]|uniref:uncharacterized protein LOC122094777 n=1 Tax=Macadamia integrifolia TaxID=60698 RepID=UPI001C5290F1|nr:uncharacterized protein LOC122094777 [Macadamia integrifolia]